VRLRKSFDVDRSRDEVVEALAEDQTLVRLFPDSKTEIVESTPDRKTTRTQYRALGRDGVATFHFTFLLDGNVRFEKVCDGRVWRELKGELEVEERGSGARVSIEMEGRTKGFVPEFTIKGPLQDQLEEMARALRERLERD
jgi:hypothetical protein